MTRRRKLFFISLILLALNLPALTSLTDPSATWWLLSGLLLTNLTILQFFLVLYFDLRCLTILTGPALVAISFGLSTMICEFLAQNGSWLSTYYLLFVSTIATIYTLFTKMLYIHQLSEFSRLLSPLLKTFTIVSLMLCSFGAPTYTLLRSVFQYPDYIIWIWAIAAALGFFLMQFTVFSSIYVNIKFYGVINPKTHIWFNVTCLMHLTFYSPTAIYLIYNLVRSLSLNSCRLSAVLLLFNASLLGLTIIPGAAFTLIHGYRYLKFIFLTRYRGLTLPWFYNRSIFALYSGASGTQPLIESQENDDDEASSPLTVINFSDCGHQTECCICLEEFKENDDLITAEGCNHIYHMNCMAKWRVMKNTCPKCRTKVKKLPFNVEQQEQPVQPAAPV